MLILSFTNEEQKTVWLVTILVSKGHYETHLVSTGNQKTDLGSLGQPGQPYGSQWASRKPFPSLGEELHKGK